MASGRITINRTTAIGSMLADLANRLADARKKLNEVTLVITKYNADASLATDAGLSAPDQTTLTNLLTQANNELNGTATTQVNVGAATGVRQLIDSLSTGG